MSDSGEGKDGHQMGGTAVRQILAISWVILAGGLAPVSGAGEPAQVVTMKEYRFIPGRITVRVGETVEWKNTTPLVHTVTADPDKAKDPEKDVRLPEGAHPFNSGRLQPGDTYRHTFTVPGLYRYFCIPHETLGMVAEVEVEPAEPTAGSSPAEEEHPGHSHEHTSPAEGESLTEEGFFPRLIHWLGKFHPAAVNFPVALLVAAAVAELLLLTTGRPLFDAASRFCVWGSAVTAPLAGLLGWCFAGFRLTDPAWVMTTHRWLGTSTAALALVVLALGEVSRRAGHGRLRIVFRVALFTAASLVLVTGFFGGALVFGLDHYAW